MRSVLLPPISLFVAATLLLPSHLHAQGKALSPPTAKSSPIALAKPEVVEASVPPPASAKPGPAALTAGSWTGPLVIPGKTLIVGLTITQSGAGLSGLLDIPGGPVRQRPLRITRRGDTLRLYEPLMQAAFTCSVSADGQQLAGSWVQVGLQQALVLHRGTPAEAGSTQRLSRAAYETKWENGTLENGQPVGVWNYYRQDAQGDYVLTRSYDHTARRLTIARLENDAFDAEVSPGLWERTVLTQSAWFIGNHDALAALGSQLRYPVVAHQRHTEGKVYVSFTVDTLGRVSDQRILRGLGNGCDEEALRIARTIPSTWTPARLGKKAVASRQILPIVFKLQ